MKKSYRPRPLALGYVRVSTVEQATEGASLDAQRAAVTAEAARPGAGGAPVLLSPNTDTGDPAGRFTANVLASAAQYKRELIGARTREGMLQRKAEGVHIGRPRSLPEDVRERIATDRAAGLSFGKIADALNAEGVPTARGGSNWYPATIRAALEAA